MNKHFYIFALLLLAAFAANAQQKDSTIKAAVIEHWKSTSILYSMNGEPLTESTVENLLGTYPASSLELNAYYRIKRNNLEALLICSAVAITAIVIGNVQQARLR
ncbi:MAG TPA: hypothetical protein VK772_15230 [Puia sp.]|jgi:hypothetical protein|nr:hypothetical protein [Puia sp.]